MSFVDPLFIFFAAFVFPVHHFLKDRFQSPVPFLLFLFAASSFFYAFLVPAHLLLLLLSSVIAWGSARFLTSPESRAATRRLLFAAAVLGILFPLFYFKYYNFVLENLAQIGWAGERAQLLLPLGISFFTFQNISYLTDVYRGTVPVERSLLRYFCYITFFPHVQAGPIMTAREFLPQLRARPLLTGIDFAAGSFYVIGGLFKKTVLADRLGGIVDPVFSDPSLFSGPFLIVAVVAYSFQIYFDFSGYSDIAIGLGRFLGYNLPENFRFPYLAVGFREFWRRWHITLSAWLRDHIFIPLGGSRAGAARLTVALVLAMLAGGLWHGAHWNFVIWGGGHGLLLVLERVMRSFRQWVAPGGGGKLEAPASGKSFLGLHELGRAISVLGTFTAVSGLWVFFRAGSYPDGLVRALSIYRRIFEWSPGIFPESDARLVGVVVVLFGLAGTLYKRIEGAAGRIRILPGGFVFGGMLFIILVLSPGGDNFIYFVF